MKKHTIMLAALMLCIALGAMVPIFASPYQSSYIGLSHGKTTIEDERIRFIGLHIGSNLTDRISLGGFAHAQLLSDLPGMAFGYNVTPVDGAFTFTIGGEAVFTLFEDAFLNPMILIGMGNMTVGYIDQSEESSKGELKIVSNSFTASVAGGFEINMFDDVTFHSIHGYRFALHETLLGIPAQALSGYYHQMGFRVSVY